MQRERCNTGQTIFPNCSGGGMLKNFAGMRFQFSSNYMSRFLIDVW